MDPSDQQTNNQFNQPQVIKPEDMFNPSVPPQPPAPSPPPTNQSPVPTDLPPIGGDDRRKKIIIIVGGLVGLFVLILLIVLITSSGGKKSPKTNSDETVQTNGILNPPSAIDVENANNSISSDITGLNDDNDFPTANLSDDNLEL